MNRIYRPIWSCLDAIASLELGHDCMSVGHQFRKLSLIGFTCLKKFFNTFNRYKHLKHPQELKNLKQSELEQLLIASIDQFGLV